MKYVALAVGAAVAAYAFVSVAERAYWVSGAEGYPTVFINDTPAEATDLLTMRRVCGSPLQIMSAPRGLALVRCGMFWPSRSVWLVPEQLVSPLPTPTPKVAPAKAR